MAGSVRNPPWYHNLIANPEVTVELNGETFQGKAVVTEGADRDIEATINPSGIR